MGKNKENAEYDKYYNIEEKKKKIKYKNTLYTQ